MYEYTDTYVCTYSHVAAAWNDWHEYAFIDMNMHSVTYIYVYIDMYISTHPYTKAAYPEAANSAIPDM